MSKAIQNGESFKEKSGTPAYIAPEILINSEYSGFASDYWSLGGLYNKLFYMRCFMAVFLLKQMI